MNTLPQRRPAMILAISLFVVTTSEFQIAAMLNDMAAGLGTSPASVGTLVTTYALGMGLGGPLVTWLLRAVPPRSALIGVIGLYTVAEAATGAAPGMSTLFALRAVTGALSGATFGLCMSLVVRLVPDSERTRASAIVLTGLMCGTLFGLPLSHLVATVFGWRASFQVLAVAAAVTALGILAAVPNPPAPTPSDAPGRGGGVRILRLWLCYAGSFLTIGGTFAAFSFIDPILRRAGLGEVAATWAMLSFGVSALLMNTIAGRVPPGRAWPWLTLGLSVQAASIVLFLLSAEQVAVAVVATIALGGTGIALNPLLVDRVLAVSAPTVQVTTLHTSAITLGIAAATALASRAYHDSGDLAATLWVGLAFTAAALLLTLTTPMRPHAHQSRKLS